MSLSRCLPALIAAVLVCFLPSCASVPDGLLAATAGEASEQARPARTLALKPVAEGVPTCIERGAGMDFDPPSADGLWPLLVFYLLIYLGYGIGFCFVRLGELIYEACDSGDEPEEESTDEDLQQQEDVTPP
jgi:hypothetical protein